MHVRGSGLRRSPSWRIEHFSRDLGGAARGGPRPASGRRERGRRSRSAGGGHVPGWPAHGLIGPLGQCESSYAEVGNNYYPPFGTLGDCGFFLAFPTKAAEKQERASRNRSKERPGASRAAPGRASPMMEKAARNTRRSPNRRDRLGQRSEPVHRRRPCSTSREKKKARKPPIEYAQITETTAYVNGEPQFTSTYDVKNLLAEGQSSTSARFTQVICTSAAKILDSACSPRGPPRFIGGLSLGVLGGFVEAPSSALPWSSFQEGCWNETGARDGIRKALLWALCQPIRASGTTSAAPWKSRMRSTKRSSPTTSITPPAWSGTSCAKRV